LDPDATYPIRKPPKFLPSIPTNFSTEKKSCDSLEEEEEEKGILETMVGIARMMSRFRIRDTVVPSSNDLTDDQVIFLENQS
jgi:hypothetical protein